MTIIARDNAFYAVCFIDRLSLAVDRIPKFPKKGRQVPEANDENIREMLFQAYRIIYRLKPEKIEILAVVLWSRDLSRLSPWELG